MIALPAPRDRIAAEAAPAAPAAPAGPSRLPGASAYSAAILITGVMRSNSSMDR